MIVVISEFLNKFIIATKNKIPEFMSEFGDLSPMQEFRGPKTPSYRQVLRLFLFLLTTGNQSPTYKLDRCSCSNFHMLTHTLRNCLSGSFYHHPLLHQHLRNVLIIGNSLQSAAKTVAAEVLKKHLVSACKTAIRLAEDVKALYTETRFRTFQKTSPTLL